MKEFGAKFGMAESTISQYETGKRQPDYETLLKFSDFFGVSVDYILTGTEGKQSIPVAKDELSSLDQRLNELLAQASEETKKAMLTLLEGMKKS